MVEETITSGTRQAMPAQSETDALDQSAEVPPARARGTGRRIAALAAPTGAATAPDLVEIADGRKTDRRKPTATELEEQVATLARLTHGELQAEWRRLFRSPPPKRMGRELLELGVAWKLQERALGGLSPADKRRLGALAQAMRAGEDLPKPRAAKLKQGARLLREWNGETHSVLVINGGFQWRGQTWRSLSAIAREITGARWSGPRFFGLKSTAHEAGAADGEAGAADPRQVANA